jgi:hypothetical protein
VEVKASVKGRGAGGPGEVTFDPLRELPRAALLLVKGQVYLTWGSSCDVKPYHGWVMAYDARTLAQTAVFNTSPEARESGIWQSDTGPAADEDGNIYVATGNGRFTIAEGGRDYGDSLLKLGVRSGSFSVLDYFTPFNEKALNSDDADVGSGGLCCCRRWRARIAGLCWWAARMAAFTCCDVDGHRPPLGDCSRSITPHNPAGAALPTRNPDFSITRISKPSSGRFRPLGVPANRMR